MLEDHADTASHAVHGEIPIPCSGLGNGGALARIGPLHRAEQTGGGHTWKLVDDQPWRRVYVVLEPDVSVPFKRADKA